MEKEQNKNFCKINNGNGKTLEYYDNGLLKYEGEILGGKYNGKGKEYYDNGKILYEGEYLNGEANGKGKEYNRNGYLIFEGFYKNNTSCSGVMKGYYINGVKHYDGTKMLKNWNEERKKYYEKDDLKPERNI